MTWTRVSSCPYTGLEVATSYFSHLSDQPADEGVGAGLGSPISHMPAIYADEAILSDVSDNRDLPLDMEVSIDKVEYAHIMRRIGVIEGEPGTSVSAFNSSI